MNKQIETRIFGNAGILIGTQVFTKLIGTIFTIVVARKLGVEDYGLYAFAVTFGHVFGIGALFGFPRLITRDVARETEKTNETLGSILVLEAVLSCLAIVAMVLTLSLLGYSFDRILIVSIAGSATILTILLDVVAAFFRAHHRMDLEARMRFSASFLNMSLGAGVLLLGYGILELAVIQFIVFSIVLIFGLYMIFGKLARPSITLKWHILRKPLESSWPFFLSSVCVLIYGSVATIFLSMMKGDHVTGLYAGAMNFTRIVGFLPASLVGAFLPAMAQLWRSSPDDWWTVYLRSVKYLIIMALPITVGLVMLSDQFVPIVLGNEYAEVATILKMVAWVILLIFLNWGMSNALISIDREKTEMRIVMVVMVFNIFTNLLLIPGWGVYGAVITSLLTEGLMLLILSIVLSKAGFRLPLSHLSLKPVISVGVMAVSVHFTRDIGLISTVLTAAAVYPLTLFVLKTFDKEELELMRSGWTVVLARLTGRYKREPSRP